VKGEIMGSSEKERVVSIMKENSLHAYLATCDGSQPHVRPVSPVVEDDMTVWVTTFLTSRKVKHIRANPRICLAFVQQPNGEKAAVLFGEAKEADDLKEKKRVWERAGFDLSQYFSDGPESKEFGLLRIAVERIEWRDGWEGGNKVYEPTHD
jgi:general stress protein 26